MELSAGRSSSTLIAIGAARQESGGCRELRLSTGETAAQLCNAEFNVAMQH
jgi:hypothetical protein